MDVCDACMHVDRPPPVFQAPLGVSNQPLAIRVTMDDESCSALHLRRGLNIGSIRGIVSGVIWAILTIVRSEMTCMLNIDPTHTSTTKIE